MPETKILKFYNEDDSYWKWLVLLGAFINSIFIWGLAWGAGVFQVIFMEEFGGNSGIVSIIPTMLPAITSLMGPVASTLTNRFGCRWVTGIGGLIAALGLMLSAFAQSKAYLFVTFTSIGIGLGLSVVPSVVVVCYYFQKWRPFAIGFAATGLGFGTLLMPPGVRFLANHYHWRGAIALLGALTLHVALTACTFRPINLQEMSTTHGTSSRHKVFQFKMLRELPFICLILNNILLLYGMVAVFIHLPAYAKSLHFNDDESALFVSIAGAATILSRILCALFMQKLSAPIVVYALSMIFGALCVIIVPFVNSAMALSVLCAGFGFGSGTLGPLLPLIVAELVDMHSLSAAYGYIMAAEGIGSLMGPPITGFLYDATSNYSLSLWLSAFTMIVSSLIMIYPFYHVRHHPLKEQILTDINQETPMSRLTKQNRSTCSDRPLLQSVDSEASNFGDEVFEPSISATGSPVPISIGIDKTDREKIENFTGAEKRRRFKIVA